VRDARQDGTRPGWKVGEGDDRSHLDCKSTKARKGAYRWDLQCCMGRIKSPVVAVQKCT
jgi:hypothetical protein